MPSSVRLLVTILRDVYGSEGEVTVDLTFPKPLPVDEASLCSNGQRRYLWTDAFGVLSYLTLAYRDEKNFGRWIHAADRLIDTVHATLGQPASAKHHMRAVSAASATVAPALSHDDFASSFPEHQAFSEEILRVARSRIIGRVSSHVGLRIGKLFHRAVSDPGMEFDGIYAHYIDKWLFALLRYAQVAGRPDRLVDAVSLISDLYPHLVVPGHGVHWKLSTNAAPIPALGAPAPSADTVCMWVVLHLMRAHLLRLQPSALANVITGVKPLCPSKLQRGVSLSSSAMSRSSTTDTAHGTFTTDTAHGTSIAPGVLLPQFPSGDRSRSGSSSFSTGVSTGIGTRTESSGSEIGGVGGICSASSGSAFVIGEKGGGRRRDSFGGSVPRTLEDEDDDEEAVAARADPVECHALHAVLLQALNRMIAGLDGPATSFVQNPSHVSADPLSWGLWMWKLQWFYPREPIPATDILAAIPHTPANTTLGNPKGYQAAEAAHQPLNAPSWLRRLHARLWQLAPAVVHPRHLSLPFRLYGALLGAALAPDADVRKVAADLLVEVIPREMRTKCGESDHGAINKVMLAAAVDPWAWVRTPNEPWITVNRSGSGPSAEPAAYRGTSEMISL